MFDVIAFDADDTLWHNETLYAQAQEQFRRLLAPFADAEQVMQTLYETEMRNLDAYGYGIKGFTLSMIETAIAVTNGRIAAREIETIIGFAREMIAADVRLLEGAAEALAALAPAYDLMLITKGDLLDQERKLARSGLRDYFKQVEIVSQKSSASYQALLQKHAIDPRRFLMVGNSLRSDILPVMAIGGQAVYVPHDLTWAHETVEPQPHENSYHELAHLGQLPPLLEKLTTTL
jgi:putative hydrolase of the HAD superfamily